MKYQSTLKWLFAMIGILAFIAAGIGLIDTTAGERYAYTNHQHHSRGRGVPTITLCPDSLMIAYSNA